MTFKRGRSPRYCVASHVRRCVLVGGINAIVYVVRWLRLRGQVKVKVKNAPPGLDFGTKLGWMKLGYMNAIWCAENLWLVVTIDASRGITEAFVHLV